MTKYEDIEEFYKEELAPTSLSVAYMPSLKKKVAIKKIFKSCLVNEFQRKQARQECELHCSLNHKNIVKALEWGENKDEYLLVLECISCPTYFKDKVDTNTRPIKNEDKLKLYMSDTLNALVYLHSQGIVHGDIKLENMLLDADEEQEGCVPTVKLCDLGLSRVLDKETKKSYMEFAVGSTSYMAPEIKANTYVDEKIDMWALGVVLYKMAVAYKPTQITGYKYGNGPIPFIKAHWKKLSPEIQDLVVKLLEFDPAKRISAQEAMQHPWFEKSKEDG